MKRNLLLLFVALSLSLILASFLDYESTQAGSPLTTELLSDHSLTTADTFFNNYGYGVETSGNIAHVYWQESGNNTEGTDLFYRQIPGGSTIQLSDPALSEGDVSVVWFDTAVAPDGTFHMIWLEDTDTTEAGDLFYWSAATGTLLLSDHTETEGYVQPALNTLSLIMDANGNPHTFWTEETGSAEGEDFFYWSLATGTVLLTDRSQTEGNDVDFGPNKLQIGDDGVVHITWGELGNDGTTPTYFYWNSSLATPVILPNIRTSIVAGNVAHIIGWTAIEGPISYWNSSTQSLQTIPSSSDPGGIIFVNSLIADSTNTVHLFWSEGVSNVCLSHWNSATQTTDDLVMGDVCYPSWSVYVDHSDNFHTVVVDQPSGTFRFRYWNDTLANPIVVPIGNTSNNGKLTGIDGSSMVHLTWIESSGSDDNYYHWDNVNQTVNNLSQLAGSDTLISSTESQIEQSSNGELYMLWSEQITSTGALQNFSWNSEVNATQNLFTELGISSLSFDFDMTMDFVESGVPYFIWHGTPTSGADGFYLWDSARDEVHLAGESLPCTEVGGPYGNDSDIFGNIYLAWQDDSTGTNYFWSEASGQVDLSLTAASDTLCHAPRVKTGDSDRVFVVWIEESDDAGEGLDIYGGWLDAPNTFGNVVYLPFITK